MTNDSAEADARAIYEESKAKLQAIIDDLGVEQHVADEAQRQLGDLGMEFASAAWDRIDTRSAHLAAISEKLRRVVEASGQDTAADALDRVTGITAGLANIVTRINTLTGREPSASQ